MKLSVSLTRDRLIQTLRWAALQPPDPDGGNVPQSPERFRQAAKRAARRGFGERW
jgi:hypothetical protein